MVIAGFKLQNKLEKVQFLKKTFLQSNTSVEMVLKIFFLTFNKLNLWFAKKKLV